MLLLITVKDQCWYNFFRFKINAIKKINSFQKNNKSIYQKAHIGSLFISSQHQMIC